MSDDPLINLDDLLEPISGSDPAGEPLSDTTRLQLDELRKEPDPFDPTTSGRKSDWPQIIRIATDTLSRTSKDLILAIRLMEALTKKHGISGFREGLELVYRLVRDCSDRLHPKPGPGEGFDIWEGAIKWLNDSTRGGQFPATIARIPLMTLQGTSYAYEDWLRPSTKQEWEEALTATKPEALASLPGEYAQWQEAYQTLQEFAKVLDEKMGAEVAPDLLSPETSGNLGNAVRACIELIEILANRHGIRLTDEPEESRSEEKSARASSGGSSSSVHTVSPATLNRDGLYRQLGEIASALERLEPHSPIPMLLHRCVRLGSLPFPKLIREIVRDTAVLEELDRLVGFQNPEE
jgi:type VI secretion system protein ImpA